MSRVPAKRWTTREDLLRQIEAVRNWIDAEPGRYSLRQLAGLAAISPYHFHRLFKSTCGKSPLDYLTDRRLERASELLINSSFTVQEICIEVGYVSPSTFSRLFKARFGLGPKAYRTANSKIEPAN